MRLPPRLEHLRQVIHEGFRFLAVGGIGYLIDLTVFNALMFAGDGLLDHKPITAKVIATVVATLVTYAGNRLWTFRHRARSGVAREYTLFFFLNGVGLVISAGCLALSRYVLELSGPIADNVSANIVGLGLASAFRFWSYGKWVFRAQSTERALAAYVD
jgi:putative flippase GtrA